MPTPNRHEPERHESAQHEPAAARAVRTPSATRIGAIALCAILLAGCAGLADSLPFQLPFGVPTPTFTPTPTNTPTPTPEPLAEGETPTPTPIPTPQVTIPQGFNPLTDERLGYSLAIPSGWTELDLRGGQIANLANMAGQGEALAQLQDFLATEEGQAIGMVALELNMMGLMQGQVPPLLNVSVLPLPAGADSKTLMGLIDANMGMLEQFGDVEVESVNPDVVNNLPAVRATARADLSAAGFPATLFVKSVGLVANEQLYLLTLAARDEVASEVEPLFDQIIGTFRPE